jgi:hypothetical protein
MRKVKNVCSLLVRPFNSSRTIYFSTLTRTDESIISRVNDFTRNIEDKKVNPSILRQQLPDILFLLTRVKSNDPGPMVENILNKLRLDGFEFTARVYKLVRCHKCGSRTTNPLVTALSFYFRQ